MNAAAAKTVVSRWEKQAAMFKEMESDCKTEVPPETISKSEYYHDLTAHLRANIRELKTLIHGPE